eukprot:g5023.t1
MESGTELSKNHVRRIVKAKLIEIYGAEEEQRRQISLGKEVLAGFAESGRVFINQVTSAANNVCRESKRTTISGEDILTALRNLGFDELIPQLSEFLEEFRMEVKEKNRKKAEIKQQKEEAATKEREANQLTASVVVNEESAERHDCETN